MQKTLELRVNKDLAGRLFQPNEGREIGSTIVRLIEVAGDDPRLPKIGEMQKELGKSGKALFYGWKILREYSASELEATSLFHLHITATFEPPGEECGTEYDESTACPKCKAGAGQVSDLILDLRKTPKSKDIARSIAGEVIVSQRLAERMTDAGLTGFELRPVRHKAKYQDDPLDLKQVSAGREILKKAEAAGVPHPTGKFWVWIARAENRPLLDQAYAEYAASAGEADKRRGNPLPVWHQLVVMPPYAEIVSPTRVGINPFDDDTKGECRCSLGDLIGLNLLSEVTVSAATRGNADFVCTKQFTGTRRGLLRPERVILVSPRVWKLLESEKVKGAEFEIAHLL